MMCSESIRKLPVGRQHDASCFLLGVLVCTFLLELSGVGASEVLNRPLLEKHTCDFLLSVGDECDGIRLFFDCRSQISRGIIILSSGWREGRRRRRILEE